MYYLIKGRFFTFSLSFMSIYDFLHIFNHRVLHFIHQMKTSCICICFSKNIIDRSSESKYVINLIPPNTLLMKFFHNGGLITLQGDMDASLTSLSSFRRLSQKPDNAMYYHITLLLDLNSATHLHFK